VRVDIEALANLGYGPSVSLELDGFLGLTVGQASLPECDALTLQVSSGCHGVDLELPRQFTESGTSLIASHQA
jgi:hypothetical protein